MRVSIRFLVFAGAFGLAIGVAYWFVTYEPAGTALLLFMGLAPLVMGGYLILHGRERPLPEDEEETTPAEAAGEPVGHFPSGSVWPIIMGLGFVIGVIGFIFGKWMVFFGILLLVWSITGLMQESRG